MRKLSSYAFILVLLLNVLGYYGVFIGMRYTHSIDMVNSFDADTYDESETVTIKVPITIAYMPDNDGFTRVNGKFEHNGEVYRLVKQKYSHDTLTIVCIKDQREKTINQALSTYVKTFTDEAGDNADNTTLTISFIKDYFPQPFAIMSLTTGWEADTSGYNSPKELTSSYLSSIAHPPEFRG